MVSQSIWLRYDFQAAKLIRLSYLFDFYHRTGGPSREFGGQKFGMRIAECGIKIRGSTMNDEFVKRQKPGFSVIPAKLVPAGFKPGAGIQFIQTLLTPAFSGVTTFGLAPFSLIRVYPRSSASHKIFSFTPRRKSRRSRWPAFSPPPGRHGEGWHRNRGCRRALGRRSHSRS